VGFTEIVDNRQTKFCKKEIQKDYRVFHGLDYPLEKEFSRLINTHQRNAKNDYG
jgi:hypothetical protein